jgi:hypothetical protein
VGSSDRLIADVVFFGRAFGRPSVARSSIGSEGQQPCKQAGQQITATHHTLVFFFLKGGCRQFLFFLLKILK